MLVYRLEDAKGRGIYRANVSFANDDERHPDPFHDPVLRMDWYGKSEYYFGFESIDHVREWFYRVSDRRHFRERGIRVVVYDTKDYICGAVQMVFRKETAVRVAMLDVLRLEQVTPC